MLTVVRLDMARCSKSVFSQICPILVGGVPVIQCEVPSDIIPRVMGWVGGKSFAALAIVLC